MPNYVTQMSKDNGEPFYILDHEARRLVSVEAEARETAVTTEEEARKAEILALKQSIIRPFSIAASYHIGEIVEYNGNFYQYMTEHAPGAFNGDEIAPTSALKLNNFGYALADFAASGVQSGFSRINFWTNGSYSTAPAKLTYNVRRLRPNKFINVYTGDKIIIKNGTGHKHGVGIFAGTISDNVMVRNDSAFITTDEEITISSDGFFTVVFANTNDTTNINPDEFDGEVLISSYAYRKEKEKEYTTINHIDGWEVGSFNGNVPTTTDKRVRNMNIYRVGPGSVIDCTGSDILFKIIILDDFGNHIDSTAWESRYIIQNNWNINFLLRKRDESTISILDVDKLNISLIVKQEPEMHIRVVSEYSIGDCSILKTKDSAILVDTGRAEDYGRLRNALAVEAINKIDYIIISHYHSDHISTSNLNNLINDYDLSECRFILPPLIPESYHHEGETEIYQRQNEILEILNNNNLAYINTYDSDSRQMMLADIRFEFYNLDHSAFYAADEDYNQMSIVFIANIGKTSVFYTGDMGLPLEDKLINIIKRTVNIAKFGHHGLNETANLNFWRKVHPDVFFSNSPEAWHDELYLTSKQIKYANYNGIKNIMTKTSGDIIIDIDRSGYSISGYNFVLSNLSAEEFFSYVIPS